MASLQWVLERGDNKDWFDSNVVVTLSCISLVALVAFVVRELRCEHPVVDLRVLRHRALVVGCGLGAVLGIGLYGAVFLFPIFTQQLLRFTAWQSGVAILPSSIATAVTMVIAGRLVWRVGPRPLVLTGAVVLTSALILMSGWTLQSTDDLFWPQLLRGVGVGLMFVPISSSTFGALPPLDVQQGAGLYNLVRQLGGSFGIAMLATLLHHRSSVHHAALAEHVSALSPTTGFELAALQEGLRLRGLDVESARLGALHTLDALTRAQAAVMSFEDCYRVLAVLFLLTLPLILLLRRPQSHAEGARSASRAARPATTER